MSKGSSQPTTSTVNQTTSSVPPQLVPYVESTLNQAETLSNQPYIPYGGQQVANQSPDTLASYAGAENLGNVGQSQYGAANSALTGAANTAAGLSGINAPTITAPGLQNLTMPGVGNVSSQSWTAPGVAQSYMSPYLNTALQSQLAISNQQFGQQQNQTNQAAIQSGAYGGDRAALQQSQNLANYNNTTQNEVAQAENNAYTTGQSAFQAGNSANLLAQEANQQAGLTTQNANLQSGLTTQGLAAQLGLTAQQSNASNYLQAQNQNLNAAQLQGSLGSQLSSLGTSENQTAQTALNALYNAGQSAQSYQQTGLNAQYNDFVNQQQYPEQQLNYLSGIEHGFNVSPNSYTQTQGVATNPVSQLVGNGIGLSSLSSLLNGQSGTTS